MALMEEKFASGLPLQSWNPLAENQRLLEKYLSIWDNCPLIKYILVYNEPNLDWAAIPENRRS